MFNAFMHIYVRLQVFGFKVCKRLCTVCKPSSVPVQAGELEQVDVASTHSDPSAACVTRQRREQYSEVVMLVCTWMLLLGYELEQLPGKSQRMDPVQTLTTSARAVSSLIVAALANEAVTYDSAIDSNLRLWRFSIQPSLEWPQQELL